MNDKIFEEAITIADYFKDILPFDYYIVPPKKIIKQLKKAKNCWWLISTFRYLSEDFIIEFKNYVDWELIYKFQKLSPEFIERFAKKLMPYMQKDYNRIVSQ